MKSYLAPQSISKTVDLDENGPVFGNELKTMMVGFGDTEHPDPETIALLEEYIIEYIQTVAIAAYKRSKRRGYNDIQLKDLMHIIFKDKKQLYRIPQLLLFSENFKKPKKKGTGFLGKNEEENNEEEN